MSLFEGICLSELNSQILTHYKKCGPNNGIIFIDMVYLGKRIMRQDHLYSETLALFTPETVAQASHLIGATPEKVQLAFSGIVPYILEAARDNSDSTALSALTTRYSDDAAFSDPGELLRSADYNDWIADNDGLIGDVFGGNADVVIDDISKRSGLRSDATRQLTLTAIPAVLGMIGRAFKPGAIPGGGLPPYFV